MYSLLDERVPVWPKAGLWRVSSCELCIISQHPQQLGARALACSRDLGGETTASTLDASLDHLGPLVTHIRFTPPQQSFSRNLIGYAFWKNKSRISGMKYSSRCCIWSGGHSCCSSSPSLHNPSTDPGDLPEGTESLVTKLLSGHCCYTCPCTATTVQGKEMP